MYLTIYLGIMLHYSGKMFPHVRFVTLGSDSDPDSDARTKPTCVKKDSRFITILT
jgi:hypothetical protein